jgi:site-specific DNA-cytosine methylase
VGEFIDHHSDNDSSLTVDSSITARYAQAIHIIDRQDPTAVAHCFTAAYGRSIVKSGSYLRTPQGIRRFSPQEIARLMGFGDIFQFPPGMTTRKAWQLIGNSLSVDAVRWVLCTLRSQP